MTDWDAEAFHELTQECEEAELEALLRGEPPEALGKLLLYEMGGGPRRPIVELLLRMGAEPNAKDDVCGQTPLSWARDLPLARLLVQAGARVACETGDTSLHLAASHGDVAMLRFLLEEADGRCGLDGFNLDLDWTPLHCAIHNGQLPAARLLLESGADPNALVQFHNPNRIGNPPLKDAVGEGSPEMVRLLLEYGADPDRPGWMACTARDAATGEMADLLAVPPLGRPGQTPHRPTIERQLLADLRHYGVHGGRARLAQGQAHRAIEQVRGLPLQSCKGLQAGNAVGAWDWVSLVKEREFRAFWTDLRTDRVLLENGSLPRHLWGELTPEQRRNLSYDGRNRRWRNDPLLAVV